MAKRKKKSAPTPSKKKKSSKPSKKALLAELLQKHPSLEREEALEILNMGISFEEWHAKKEEEREARRIAKEKRMIAFICSQHKNISEEEATFIVKENITPEEFLERRAEEQRKARARARQQERQQKRHRGRKPPPRGGGPRGGAPRAGGKKRSNRLSKEAERKAKLDRLVSRYPDLTRAVAGQLLRENISYEEFLKRRAQKKKKSLSTRTSEERDRAKELQEERMKLLAERLEQEAHLGSMGDEFLRNRSEEGNSVSVWRFHSPRFEGVITEIQPLMLIMKTEHQEALRLRKLGCVFVYVSSEADAILSQIHVNLDQMSLLQYPPREPSRRIDLSDDLLESGSSLSLVTHDGLLLKGKVGWSDRFQFLLELDEGGVVFVFKHSVAKASEGNEFLLESSTTLKAFLEKSPDMPNNHPKELALEDILVPVQFDDYDVKDKRYEEISELFDAGKFQLHPIRIRREGEQYVLLDGYRRLTLAREKELPKIPVRVM